MPRMGIESPTLERNSRLFTGVSIASNSDHRDGGRDGLLASQIEAKSPDC